MGKLGVWVKVSRNKEVKVYPNTVSQVSKIESSAPAAHVWPAEGVTLEHLDKEPMTFYSKRDMINACKERGMVAGDYYG